MKGRTMTPEEIKREQRKQRRFQRLGTNNPRCAICGETHWACFEEHHIAGRKHDSDFTVFVCTNCHRKLTEDQKDHPPAAPDTPPFLVSLRECLLGIADLLRLAAAKLVELADKLLMPALSRNANQEVRS